MTCMGHYEIKPPVYEKLIEENKCTCINSGLENGLIYLHQVICSNVVNDSTTYTKYNRE